METISELKKKVSKIHQALKTIKTAAAKKKLKESLAKVEAQIHKIQANKAKPMSAADKRSLKSLAELIKKTKSLSAYKGQRINLSADAKRQALPKGWRVSKSGNKYYEGRPNRYDVRQSGRWPRLEHGGELHRTERFAEGGAISPALETLESIRNEIEGLITSITQRQDYPVWFEDKIEEILYMVEDISEKMWIGADDYDENGNEVNDDTETGMDIDENEDSETENE